MAQPIEEQLSDEDYQLINANGLGPPLAVYKMKPIYLSFLFAMGICFLILGLTIGGLVLSGDQGGDKGSFASFVMYMGLSLVGFLTGIYVLLIELPRVQMQHIIVCEQGLLQMKELSRDRKMKVVYWRDVLTIRRLNAGYYIRQRDGEVFTFDMLYQHVKELVAHIKQRSKENDNHAGSLEGDRLNREQLVLRAIEPVKRSKFLGIVLYGGIGLYVLFACTWVITGRPLFAWLMCGFLVLIPVVIVTVSYWRIKKIVKQIKANTPEE